MSKYSCNFQITTSIPDDSWAAELVKVPLWVDDFVNSNEYELIECVERLLEAGYKETKTYAIDGTYMMVFYSNDLGWRVITCNVKV